MAISTGPAPPLSLPLVDGGTINLAELKGRVVMVDFWSSWCPPCIKEAPVLAETYREYAGQEVEFVGVAIWDEADDVNRYIRQFDLGYPNGLDGENIPLMARISAVADTFDAITTNRPYQECMTFDQGRARINELRGKYLDACVVDAFNAAYDEGLFQPGEGDEEVEALPAPPPPQALAPGPMLGETLVSET